MAASKNKTTRSNMNLAGENVPLFGDLAERLDRYIVWIKQETSLSIPRTHAARSLLDFALTQKGFPSAKPKKTEEPAG